MENQIRFDSVSDYNAFNQHETLHPLVTVVDLSKADTRQIKNMYLGLYFVMLKGVACGDLRYGKQNYDYQEGTLVFFAPGQVVTLENELYRPNGYALVFHPGLLHGTALNQHIHEYSFFSYQTHESLHISEREKQIVLDCLAKIRYELEHALDHHSRKLIVSNIELFLDYCKRFYDRQFLTRDTVHKGIIERFESLLTTYFLSDKPSMIGLPSVAYFASELNLSTKYFGDLVRKETGQTAQDYIQAKLIDVAKEKIFDQTKTVSEIAFEMGFKYPQHFSRLFKQHVGQTPNAFRGLRNLN
ncbi:MULTISPECIES: AraC family transcriptional regulator [Dyadobacter]|uniref:Helix-turn-helix domain-containing protein n=1 Tax=Dyadobacter chenhuakuii TaxID=2909339 RepID=A0ABY4XN70_9BACT|nr:MULTISPECIES: helix-turn-helix domain-containing protein [Dyadobacter]MCF2494798.1 helix-turn-helix domain-containing protein [Dyadobacter chenhuakuii]MCF2519124.1 helix-turn-helix domain-containing protein [Dyadobacter sp. CY351]USJ31882.1 helix-turn-helix domain-containing protein [Dyadobacter chenhuakuii]